MSADLIERKLAAILAADVSGYSRMMEVDEAGTLSRVKAHIGEVVRPFKQRTDIGRRRMRTLVTQMAQSRSVR